MISRLLTASALILPLVFAVPASAQDRLSRTELTTATTQLRETVGDIEAKSNQLQVQNADLSLKLRELQAENEQLTGRVETLQFQLGQSNDNIDRMVADDREIGRRLEELDQKISSLEIQLANSVPIVRQGDRASGGTSVSGGASGGATGGQPPTTITRPAARGGTAITSITRSDRAEPAQSAAADAPSSGSLGTIPASSLPGEAGPLFADAKARLLRFDYAGAETSFKAFLTSFGDDPQAGEAQYWLGEVLYQQKSYAESGQAYQTMIQQFPSDVRAPDALVKLGRSLRLVGELEKACAVLGTLPTRYPDASPVTRNLANVERSRSDCDS